MRIYCYVFGSRIREVGKKMKKKDTRTEYLRTEIYPICLNLMKKGLEIEAYILILATWNFASLRYVMTTFDLRKFKRVLIQIEPLYKKLKNLDFKSVKLDNYEKEIKTIYSLLSSIKGIQYTGAPKLMHLKNPELFVMWDGYIRKHYGFTKGSDADYFNFLKLMRMKFENIKLRRGLTLARTIDLINMEEITEKVLAH